MKFLDTDGVLANKMWVIEGVVPGGHQKGVNRLYRDVGVDTGKIFGRVHSIPTEPNHRQDTRNHS